MKAYVWSDAMPPPATRRATWRRFVERHLPNVVIYLMVATLVAVVLYPHVVVTVPSGQSTNSKIVVIGSGKDGLPVIFGNAELPAPPPPRGEHAERERRSQGKNHDREPHDAAGENTGSGIGMADRKDTSC